MSRFLRTHVRNIPWSGVELPAVHKKGHEFPCELAFGVWEEDERVMFTGFARDITVRKHALEEEKKARAEAEAARSQLERRAEEEASFRHLASALTGAVEMSDVLYEITNRATLVTRADGVYVERILNAERQVEVVSTSGRGTPTRGTIVDYPGSMTEEILERRQPVILTDMARFGRSMAPYLMDTCGNCEVLVSPLIAEDEPLGALVLLNSASSGRRFRDADIIRARTLGDMTSLALRRVRLMEQEREAKEKAEAAVRVRDETLGIVSHDLRNPLTKISLSADLLVDAAPEDQTDLVQTIRSAARQMERLIQDLLDVARLEAGRFSVEKSMIDPEPIVRYACQSNEPIAQQKKLKIVCHIESPLPQICADHDRLLQVFGNLVGNAMKFTPERGTITLEAAHRKGTVEFRVRDNGPGIPEADVKNVFRAYWQAKKTAHMGAGLGLAIVRGIVEAHGGRVWAENAAGGGAVFKFTIPVL
jgi:signal transduction histidine kinase